MAPVTVAGGHSDSLKLETCVPACLRDTSLLAYHDPSVHPSESSGSGGTRLSGGTRVEPQARDTAPELAGTALPGVARDWAVTRDSPGAERCRPVIAGPASASGLAPPRRRVGPSTPRLSRSRSPPQVPGGPVSLARRRPRRGPPARGSPGGRESSSLDHWHDSDGLDSDNQTRMVRSSVSPSILVMGLGLQPGRLRGS